MTRRVGFGKDGGRFQPPTVGSAAEPTELPETAPPPKRESAASRWVVAGLLALWVAGWGFAIVHALGIVSGLWAGGPGDAFDWMVLAFFALWLVFALVAWAFGVVILVVTLFGKPISPERLAERRARRAARRDGGG